MRKKETVANHHKLWDEIIRLIKERKYSCMMDIKSLAWRNVFPETPTVHSMCFGCEWNIKTNHTGYLQGCNKYCLFDVKNIETEDCLDCVYEKLKNSITRKQYKVAEQYAIRIRNWPVK